MPPAHAQVREREGLSVVTVTMNNRDGLMATYLSLCPLLDPSIEWIIVDGNSSDGTAELLGKISSAGLAHVLCGPDDGIYDAMNKGLRVCSREWITFLNAGDRVAAPSEWQVLLNTLRGGSVTEFSWVMGVG